MGLGYVEAHVDKGVLVAIDGNGFGPLKIDKVLTKQIQENIKANNPAPITAVEATD